MLEPGDEGLNLLAERELPGEQWRHDRARQHLPCCHQVQLHTGHDTNRRRQWKWKYPYKVVGSAPLEGPGSASPLTSVSNIASLSSSEGGRGVSSG